MKGVNRVVTESQQQIAHAAELLAAEVNDWQTIQNYITRRVTDIKLSPEQETKLKRYQFIYNQLSGGRFTDEDVVSQLEDHFSISYVQALKDIRDAKELYTVAFQVNKQFEIKLQLTLNRIMLDKANNMQDLKAYAALEKNRQKLLAMLPDDADGRADDFEGHTYQILFEPELLGIEPINNKDLEQFLQTIKEKFGVSVQIPGFMKQIEDAEILEENNEQDTLQPGSAS